MTKTKKTVTETNETNIPTHTLIANAMYNVSPIQGTTININESYEGETIEMKIDRVLNNGEPIEDGAPIIYTERKDGVIAETDIRTDRFDAALDLTDKMHASHVAERQSRIEKRESLKNPENKLPGKDQGTGEESGA